MKKLNQGEFILVATQSSTNGSIDMTASTFTFDEDNCGQALQDISSEFPNAGSLYLVTGLSSIPDHQYTAETTPEGNRVVSRWSNSNPGVGQLSYPTEETLYELVHNNSSSNISTSSSQSSKSSHSHS